MAESFTSSVPGIYSGLLKLIREAASEQPEEIEVFPFALQEYKPASYVILGPIVGPLYEVEAVPLQLVEHYEIEGKAFVYRGETPAAEYENEFAEETLSEAFNLWMSCVVTPALKNRGAPTFGTKGPSAQKVVPLEAKHEAGPGVIGGTTGGWVSAISWSIHFEAIINPAPAIP